jgi:hypothetical protein
MRAHNPDRRKPGRPCRPACEGLEARDLPSATPLVSPASTPGRPFPDPAIIAHSLNLLYGPGSATPRIPTRREAKREVFTARFAGTYVVTPPRFNDRASTIHFFSKNGGSNASKIAKLQMVLFPPANPQATPNPGNPFANQVTGFVGIFPQNFLQTGGILILDVVGSPESGSTPQGLPTHLSWTNDSFASAGQFVNPSTDFFQGTGVLDIQYHPDRHPVPGSLGSGRMVVSFQGALNYSQLMSDVSPAIS